MKKQTQTQNEINELIELIDLLQELNKYDEITGKDVVDYYKQKQREDDIAAITAAGVVNAWFDYHQDVDIDDIPDITDDFRFAFMAGIKFVNPLKSKQNIL